MKAILVFDINDLTYKGIKECFTGDITLHLEHHGFYEIKDVELKHMSQRMKVDYDTISTAEVTEKVVAIGWNACIKTILGEEE